MACLVLKGYYYYVFLFTGTNTPLGFGGLTKDSVLVVARKQRLTYCLPLKTGVAAGTHRVHPSFCAWRGRHDGPNHRSTKNVRVPASGTVICFDIMEIAQCHKIPFWKER
ncbi:MAG: hypothetical protein GPOALKHO_001500 [Sodalis sp.]|nr:MAG: hypothetical protein GPOALKHO_001500 [Sodalis sp.]